MSEDEEQEYFKAYHDVIKTKIPLYTKLKFFLYFRIIILKTVKSSSLSLYKDHRFFIQQKSIKHRTNHWFLFTKMLSKYNKEYSISEIIARYLILKAKKTLRAILRIAKNNQEDAHILLKTYLYLCQTTIELNNADKIFRNLVNRPKKNEKKLNIETLLQHSKEQTDKEKDEKEAEQQKLKIYYRYNVITPFIHYNNINPIDSIALTQRLMDNYELIRFQKIHLKNIEKIEKAKYDPLTKRKKILFKKKIIKDCLTSRNRSCGMPSDNKINSSNCNNNPSSAGKLKPLLLLIKNQSNFIIPTLQNSSSCKDCINSSRMALFSTKSKSTANIMKGDNDTNSITIIDQQRQHKLSKLYSSFNNKSINSNKNYFTRRAQSIIPNNGIKNKLKNYFLKKDLYY